MPRLKHEASERHWPYELQMTLMVLVQEINALRAHVGLPPRTAQDIRQAMVAYQQSHRREGRA